MRLAAGAPGTWIRCALLLPLALALPACGPDGAAETAAGEGPLKALAAERGIRFGAYYQYDIRGDRYDRVFETEMSLMTVGVFWNEGVHGVARAEYNFAETDAQVDWGQAHGMDVFGQTLLWFEDIPDWVNAAPLSDIEAVMNEHIDAVVGRYRGRIRAWNVVNEAVNGDGALRQNHRWAEALGNDYIRRAFVRARAADPSAFLYYNDFDIESNAAKFEGVRALLVGLKEQGAPVQGLGWQLHVMPGSFSPDTLLARLNEIADLGFDNIITELDVELPPDAGPSDFEQQRQTYRRIVEIFLSSRRHRDIVVWGLRDGDPYWLTTGHPLLFDEGFNRKPAYFGAREGLRQTP